MRGFFYAFGFLTALCSFAMAQTADSKPDTQPSPPSNEETAQAPETRKEPAERDLDEFFKEGEKQLEEDGQSCQPEPEPIS